jgi:hypothetical protein
MLRLLAIILVPILAVACASSSTSTTPRTAVEQALLSESAEAAINQISEDNLFFYKRFIFGGVPATEEVTVTPVGEETRRLSTRDVEFEAYDRPFLLSELRRRLTQHGMQWVRNPTEADVIVFPRSAVAAIDESRVLIGVPEIPLPIPSSTATGGFLKTPELALFRLHEQQAYTRLGVYGIDAKDGSLAFDLGTRSSMRYYNRWVILAIITFRTTNLTDPHRKTTEPNPPK